MVSLVGLVKLFVPGSTAFLLLAVAIGVALLYVPRAAKWARRWLVLIVLVYLVLALPIVAGALESGLHPPYPRIERMADARGATAIVVLGNGVVTYEYESGAVQAMTRRTAMNVLEGVRLHRLLPGTRVIVSGGVPGGASNRRPEAVIMAEAMAALGVPREAIAIEPGSRNTREQGLQVARLIGPGGPGGPVVLVTTPIHMRRALDEFAARGIDAVPSPAGIEYMPRARTWAGRLVPTSAALRVSELTIYERLAAVLARIRESAAPPDEESPRANTQPATR